LPGTVGNDKRVIITLNGSGENHRAIVHRLDSTHGSLARTYETMGKPAYPTQAQIQALRTAASLPPPENVRIQHGQLTIVVPPQGLALVEFH
jgi:xylan 1,4-beta-xylosidase